MADAFDRLIAKIDAGWNPPPLNPKDELDRTRMIILALENRMARVAEQKHPGILNVLTVMKVREEKWAKAYAEQGL